jgi:outer membrane scaffolding protein for murein synthesis (MipA/OmpV family)
VTGHFRPTLGEALGIAAATVASTAIAAGPASAGTGAGTGSRYYGDPDQQGGTPHRKPG